MVVGAPTARSFSAPDRSLVPRLGCRGAGDPAARARCISRRVEGASGLTSCPMANTTCMSRGAAMPKRPASISAPSAQRSHACSYAGESNVVVQPAWLFDLRSRRNPGCASVRSRHLAACGRSGSPSPAMVARAFQRWDRRSDCFPFRRMAFWRTPVPIWSMPSRLGTTGTARCSVRSASPAEYGTVRLSPDDKRAALERTGARAGVWLLEVATGIPMRLTFGCRKRSRLVARRAGARVHRHVGQLT